MANGATNVLGSGRLFILGAGFSAGAKIPLTSELLGSSMGIFARDCPGIFSRVDRYARTAFGAKETPNYKEIDLAKLCTFLHYIELKESGGLERFSAEGSRENLALKHYLAKTIVAATPRGAAIPSLYIEFAKQLRPEDIVITFNWDCLLEGALEQVEKAYSYTFEEGAIRLAKLHGSVNWRLGQPATPSLEWRSLEYAAEEDEPEVFSCVELQDIETWAKWRGAPIGEVQPFLVLPGFGKAFDVRRLASLWYKPEFAFGYTQDVFVIGLSLAEDDFIIRSFLMDNLPDVASRKSPGRVVVINRDEGTRKNYAFAPQIDFRAEKFDLKHLKEM